MPCATASKARSSRAASTTAAPASANARAVAAPIPRLAPATSATFPSNGADIVSSEEPAAVVTFLLCFIGTPSRALM